MIKAILVDDEAIILNKLRAMKLWANLNIDVVATCSDGDEAFEAICDLSPDLVITDIKMPTLSGIELIRLLQKANMYPKVIFVTGYSDFEYTRDAIRLGAYDYILKPVSEEDLNETMVQCITDIQDEKRRMKNTDREFCELQLKHYFDTLSQNRRTAQMATVSQDITERFPLTEVALNTFTTFLTPETSPTNVDYEECLQLIRRLNFTLGLENYFAFAQPQKGALLIISFRTKSSTATRDFSVANKAYMSAVQEALFDNLGVEGTVHCSGSMVIDDAVDVEALYGHYVDALSETAPSNDNKEEGDDGHKYIHDALSYIHSHYSHQLRLQDVANAVYLSESHFSTLFTRHMGTSFSKYLAKYRIEKSKAYMQKNPYAKIYEISSSVGYSDARYFSTLFKKTEGMTPSEYLQQLF